MPHVVRWPHKRLVALAAACFALLVAAAPAAADAPCAPAPPSQVFAQFGDFGNYAPVAGGTFEGDLSGWALDNASVLGGNEPWYVNSQGDTQSLSIAPSGSAGSPTFCLSDSFPSWRFFARSSGAVGALYVSVQWTDKFGNTGQTPVTVLPSAGYAGWAVSPPLVLGALLDNGRTVGARLVFSAAPGATWSVDDVYLDPYAK